MKLNNTTILASTLLCLALPIAHAKAAMIENGDFSVIHGTLATGGICTSNPSVFGYSPCQADAWHGVYQITNGVSGFGVPQPDPMGGNTLILQTGDDASSSASQNFTAPIAGEYKVSFYAANRCNGDEQTLSVSIDDSIVATFDSLPTTWTLETVYFHADAGHNTLTLSGLKSIDGDASAFVNGVSISSAPEPGVFALLGLGLIGLGLMRRKIQQA